MILGSEQSFTFFDFYVLRFGCGGGFGTIGRRSRAVKTIDKRLHPKAHYSRELLVMAVLGKACILTLREFAPVYLP